MKFIKKHKLINIDWPNFGICKRLPISNFKDYMKRISKIKINMEKKKLTHLIVYGDREHFANITYLTGYDPRFEESILIIKKEDKPLVLVGNEGKNYLNISPLVKEGEIRYELFQSFSLLSQDRKDSRSLKDIFIDERINKRSIVGCIGWKYFLKEENLDAAHSIEIPSYIVDIVRELVGYDNVINVSDILMHPEYGLRTYCSSSEIAFFEYSNTLASEGIKRMIKNIKVGMTDYELAEYTKYNGVPLSFHTIIGTKKNFNLGFPSPCGFIINRKDPISMALGYWGSNICRVGWVASSELDLPEHAKGYVKDFAGIYFEAMNEWYMNMRIGKSGGELAKLILKKLPYKKFGIDLNPGHLIHLDEWVSSPIFLGSDFKIHSGMYFQVDVIPFSNKYFSTRMEEGIIIADKNLQYKIKKEYPECFNRCQERRNFVINTIGIDLPEEILPLSNMAAIVPVFFLEPNIILSLK